MGLLCDLQLDNVAGIYQPGDIISGRIALTLEERILIKALALKISGYAGVGWVNPIKEKKKNKSKHNINNGELIITPQEPKQKVENYNNREDYVSTVNYFIGSEAATAKLIESGNYAYTFSARLPDQCPATFASQIGHIRYELDVFIDFPDRRHTCMARSLTVNRPYDLRQQPTLMQPSSQDLLESTTFAKFWQRPMQMHVHIPQSGYVPGEEVSVHVKVVNDEHLKLLKIIYKLNQVGVYTGVHKKKVRVKSDSRNLHTHEHVLNGFNSQQLEHLHTITIPNATEPTIDADLCKCIQLMYEIDVQVQTSNRKRMLHAVLPIKVGTISLKSNMRVLPRDLVADTTTLIAARSMDDLSSTSTLEVMSSSAYLPTAPTPDTPNMAQSMNNLASSFREADFMVSTNLNKKEKHAMSGDKIDFKPKYLYYDMENASSNSAPSQTTMSDQIEAVPEIEQTPTAPTLSALVPREQTTIEQCTEKMRLE